MNAFTIWALPHSPVYGYKAFDGDLKCQDFQFEIGGVYEESGAILCLRGFHFCRNIMELWNYKPWNISRVCKVRCWRPVGDPEDKECCEKIEILEEITREKLLKLCNSGHSNSGHSNSGNSNSGNWNSGHSNSGNWNSGHSNSGSCNSGNRNSGNWNSGNRNSGNWNSGHSNSGNWNSGHSNSGSCNSGNRNSGNWNSGHSNSGHLNSTSPEEIRIFNKYVSLEEWGKAEIPNYFNFYLDKGKSYKECWQKSYEEANEEDKLKTKKLPNFDADVFFEITGIKID